MITKANQIDTTDLLKFYRSKAEELEYNFTVERMVNQQYQKLLELLVKKHPELKKEVMNDDNQSIKSGLKQK